MEAGKVIASHIISGRISYWRQTYFGHEDSLGGKTNKGGLIF
jgi:hypothetical protein